MIKSIYFPSRVFGSQDELIHELVKNEALIIDYKKSLVYNSQKSEFKAGVTSFYENGVSNSFETIKAIGIPTKSDWIYPIISTTNYYDSHGDVHWDNSMNKTAKEQKGSVYFCADHELNADGVIVSKSDNEMYLRQITWDMVGKDYAGTTNAIIFGFNKDKRIHAKASLLMDKEKDIQCSIRMIYIDVKLGVKTKSKDYATQNAYYEENIDRIVNKDEVEKEGYFFGVEQLRIYKEGSMCVGGGSNDATSIYENMSKTEAASSTSIEIEPSKDTQAKTLNIYELLKTI